MRPMTNVRHLHFEQLQNSLKTARYIVQTADPQALTTCRDTAQADGSGGDRSPARLRAAFRGARPPDDHAG